ncbi:MAG: DUF1194 domain-containing protein [Leptolyngbya sp. RL_3_1]|nr:DUF1194 domain-containing protein [Leptolyngbya sp. RL_3_1]
MVNQHWARLGVASVAIAASTWIAPATQAATLVNTELVLSVDASGSVSPVEFALQQQGYVAAFRDAELIELIAQLDRGIAVTLQYWGTIPAGALGWYHITDAASAHAFADAIAATTNPFSRSATNIAAALDSATTLLLTNAFEGDRRVIDISGDGTQNVNLAGTAFCSAVYESANSTDPNCTSLVTTARDRANAAGITLNGLPILTDFAPLDDYYLTYVVGGEGAFIQAAETFGDFGTAVKTKIKREIAPAPGAASVPEPSMVLGVLALGGLGATVKRWREQSAQ